MAAIKAFFSIAMAVIQLAFMVAFPSSLGSGPIDYGGGYYYSTAGVTNWLVLAQDGASGYRIVKPAVSSAALDEGAVQLQDYFERITGAALPIVPDSAAAQTKEICIGDTNRGGPSTAALGPEGFVKKVIGETVFLAGKDARGTLYAVFSFLEEQLGVRWFTPSLTVVPESALLRVDAGLDDTQEPVFEYRDDYWGTVMHDAGWKAHQKVNGFGGAALGARYGGGVTYADFCHSFDRLLPVSMFAAKPELFSWRADKGAWTDGQRCLTNPEVLSIIIANTRACLLANPSARIMSITQCDNQEYCQCPNCEAEAARLGGQSGLMVWFTNQVARALKSEFPDILFDTFAYQYTRHAPTVRLPGENIADSNVCVRLCSIECCFCHPLETCGHERGESLGDYVSEMPSSFAKDMRDWNDFCNYLYIWDYVTNFNLSLLPFPNFQVLAPNMRFFAQNNVRGIFAEGMGPGTKSGEFGEMRAYVLAKLLWDPDADVEYHMMDFMKAYYGENAAPHIKKYIDSITRKTVATSHLFCFNWHYQNTFLRCWDTRPMDRLWDKAEKAAPAGWQLDNVRRSRLQLRFYKACMLVDEFFPLRPCRVAENKKFFNDVVNLGVIQWDEFHAMVRPQGLDWLMRPVEWVKPGGLFWNKGKIYEPMVFSPAPGEPLS